MELTKLTNLLVKNLSKCVEMSSVRLKYKNRQAMRYIWLTVATINIKFIMK